MLYYAVRSFACICFFVQHRGIGSDQLARLVRAKGNIDVCQQCIWALGNLAGDSLVSLDAVLDAGVLKLLVEHIERLFAENSIADLKVCSWFLASLTRGDRHVDVSNSNMNLILPALRLIVYCPLTRRSVLPQVAPHLGIVSKLLHVKEDPEVAADTCFLLQNLASRPNRAVLGSPPQRKTAAVDGGARTLRLLQTGVTRRLVELLYVAPACCRACSYRIYRCAVQYGALVSNAVATCVQGTILWRCLMCQHCAPSLPSLTAGRPHWCALPCTALCAMINSWGLHRCRFHQRMCMSLCWLGRRHSSLSTADSCWHCHVL